MPSSPSSRSTNSRSKPYSGKMTVSSLEIEPARNGGFTLRKRLKPANPNVGEMSYPYMDPQTYVYESFAGLVDGLKDCFLDTGVISPKEAAAEAEGD